MKWNLEIPVLAWQVVNGRLHLYAMAFEVSVLLCFALLDCLFFSCHSAL